MIKPSHLRRLQNIVPGMSRVERRPRLFFNNIAGNVTVCRSGELYIPQFRRNPSRSSFLRGYPSAKRLTNWRRQAISPADPTESGILRTCLWCLFHLPCARCSSFRSSPTAPGLSIRRLDRRCGRPDRVRRSRADRVHAAWSTLLSPGSAQEVHRSLIRWQSASSLRIPLRCVGPPNCNIRSRLDRPYPSVSDRWSDTASSLPCTGSRLPYQEGPSKSLHLRTSKRCLATSRPLVVLSEHFLNNTTSYVGEPHVPAAVEVGQF